MFVNFSRLTSVLECALVYPLQPVVPGLHLLYNKISQGFLTPRRDETKEKGWGRKEGRTTVMGCSSSGSVSARYAEVSAMSLSSISLASCCVSG